VYSLLDEELGYTQGMNHFVEVILRGTSVDEEATFAIFEKMMRGEHNWRRFYTEGLVGLESCIRCVMEWINTEIPNLKYHFNKAGIPLGALLAQPILTLFA
jgi:hypothetical protein